MLRSPFALACRIALVSAALAVAGFVHADPVPGFVETWPQYVVNGWEGGAGGQTIENGGFNGVGGEFDGYLYVSRSQELAHHFGVRNRTAPYQGDWMAANIVQVRFSLNDLESDENHEIHFSFGYDGNLWQYDPGFSPPEQQWQEFIVDLTDSTQFSHIIANDGRGFAAALQGVTTLLIRHDRAPFAQHPDVTYGDVGIDHLQLLSPDLTPVISSTWGRIKRLYR